jgi:hypothetical protein
MPTKMRLIGDSHGDLTTLSRVVGDHLTIHLGDLGFRKSWRKADLLPNLLVLGGNHDDYSVAPTYGCYLGDYGDLGERVPGIEGVFFCRGAFSIDRGLRTENLDWWAEEELSDHQLLDALDFYGKMRPRLVLSHEAPLIINHMLYGGEMIQSRTATALWRMFQAWEPEQWYFGHHHVQWERQVGQTRFRCLAIDEVIDVQL